MMTDCLRCHLPLDDDADLVGALQHAACPEDALDEEAILRVAIEARGARRGVA